MRDQQEVKVRGRKPDANSTSGKIRALLATNIAPGDIAKKLGCTPALVYNVKARMSGSRGAGRGSVRAARSSAPTIASLSNVIGLVRDSEAERTRLQRALEKIADLVREALE